MVLGSVAPCRGRYRRPHPVPNAVTSLQGAGGSLGTRGSSPADPDTERDELFRALTPHGRLFLSISPCQGKGNRPAGSGHSPPSILRATGPGRTLPDLGGGGREMERPLRWSRERGSAAVSGIGAGSIPGWGAGGWVWVGDSPPTAAHAPTPRPSQPSCGASGAGGGDILPGGTAATLGCLATEGLRPSVPPHG